MHLIDYARPMLTRAQDWMIPQRVVFHHVPKCGGTSVGRALRMRYIMSQATVTPESSFRAFEIFTGRTDREQMLIDVAELREQMLLYYMFEDVRCLSLHVPFSVGAHERFHKQYKFITILREPVKRFISHYFWSHDKPQAHARIEEGFEAFLETDRAKRLGASYVEFFCGQTRVPDLSAPEVVDAAIANLQRFSIVGRLDDLKSFKVQLKEQLGIRVGIGHENKMRQPESEKKRVLTPELMERARVLCAPDLAVWNAIHG